MESNERMIRSRKPAALIDYRKFITAWQASSSVAEVVERTGLTPIQVKSASYHLRDNSVPLKSFRKKHDFGVLAEFAQALLDADASAQE